MLINSIYVSKRKEKNYYIIIPKWYKCHYNFEILMSLNIYDTLTNWTKKNYILFLIRKKYVTRRMKKYLYTILWKLNLFYKNLKQ